jgi:hypothetical protein
MNLHRIAAKIVARIASDVVIDSVELIPYDEINGPSCLEMPAFTIKGNYRGQPFERIDTIEMGGDGYEIEYINGVKISSDADAATIQDIIKLSSVFTKAKDTYDAWVSAGSPRKNTIPVYELERKAPRHPGAPADDAPYYERVVPNRNVPLDPVARAKQRMTDAFNRGGAKDLIDSTTRRLKATKSIAKLEGLVQAIAEVIETNEFNLTDDEKTLLQEIADSASAMLN